MDNIFEKIEQFLLNNAWGVIIGGIIASVVGTVLCLTFKKIIEFLKKKFNIRKKKQRFLKYTVGYYRGYAAAYSIPSSYRQVLLVGDFLMDSLFEVLKIMVYLIVTCIFIGLSRSLLINLLLIVVSAFGVYTRYLKLKEIKKSYQMTFDSIFGEDFTKKCVEGAIESMKKHSDSQDEPDNPIDNSTTKNN